MSYKDQQPQMVQPQAMPHHMQQMPMQPQYGHMQPVSPYQGQQMPHKKMDKETHKKEMFKMCKEHHLHYIHMYTVEGQFVEGIIDEIDDNGVTLICPCGDMDRNEDGRVSPGWGPGFPGYGGFGPGFGYGYPRRFRRFRRHRYPFYNVSRIFFPFFF